MVLRKQFIFYLVFFLFWRALPVFGALENGTDSPAGVFFQERDRQHLVYFSGTPQELEVYKIHGRQEGPTIMILGGIQGDEPGGFLSADLYADMALKKGNLIVVPRANFKSILMFHRGQDGDMNRKFDGDLSRDPDGAIVSIIKELMAESDLFLNLHDGSGYYRPVWENDLANPRRFGQCIIADTDVYVHGPSGRAIELEEFARQVILRVNEEINEPLYKFHFLNTETTRDDSQHLDQRKSATYYALTQLGIPAFGIEASKQLPTLEMKIHQHNLAVNAFMELFGVVPEQPRIKLETPALDYLVIEVNQGLPLAVANGQTLLVAPGDTIEVVHVGANYDRGLSVDILDRGTWNDFRRPVVIDHSTSIVVQKDHTRFGRVELGLLPPLSTAQAPQVLGQGWTGPRAAADVPLPPQAVEPAPGKTAEAAAGLFEVVEFIIEVDGRERRIKPDQEIDILEGSLVKVVNFVTADGLEPPGLVLNLKGFVADPTNHGEDREATADTGRDLLADFSLSRAAPVYALAVERGLEILSSCRLRLAPPKLATVTVNTGGRDRVLKLGGRLQVPPGSAVTVKEVALAGGQVLGAPRFTLGGRGFPASLPQTLTMPNLAVSLAVFNGSALAGKVVLAP